MKKRILIINLYAEMGGGEITVLNLLKNLDRTRFEPVMMFNCRGPFVEQVEKLGAETVILPYPAIMLKDVFTPSGWNTLRKASAEFERYLSSSPVDLIHCNDVLVLLLIAHAVRKHNVPVVYNVIFKYEWTRILLFNLYALRIVKKIIVNSPMIRGDLHRRTAGLRDRTETIPLGVNGAIYHPQRDGEENILRKAHNTPANTKLVGMVARYDRIKGHETFLRAATRVCEVRQDVKFFIIGGSVLVNQIPGAGEYRGKILNLRRELHLENTVTFIDEHPDVPALMRSLDLLVCPSDSEGFGLVVLEALASGVLVIASRFIGAVEYLDGEPGIFIAEPHSTESFVCVMLHVLEHLDHGNSRYTVSERLIRRFTWQTHASACERVYEECSL